MTDYEKRAMEIVSENASDVFALVELERRITAALKRVRAEVIEECAKVAEFHRYNHTETCLCSHGEIADAIHALAGGKK